MAAPMGGALVDVARQPPAAGGMLVETAGQTEAPIVRVANHGRRPATLLLRDGDGHSYGLLVQPGRSGEIGVPPGHYTADITPEDNGAPVTSGDAVFRRFRDYEVVLVDYPRGTSVDGFRLGDR